MYLIQTMSAEGRWYELPYEFATRDELNAFITTLRQRNPGRAFRCAKAL